MSQAKQREEVGPLFRMALDFGPILVFFLVNNLAGGPQIMRVVIATAAFMLATAVAMIVSKLRTGAISPMLWPTTAAGSTLQLRHSSAMATS